MSMPNPVAEAPQMDQSAWWLSATTWAVDSTHAPPVPVPYKIPEYVAQAMKADSSTAYIPVQGVLTPSSRWWGTSYDSIKVRLSAAAQDPSVERIVLYVNSPGGDAAGMAGAIEAVKAAAESKAVIAWVDGLCCSAAYGIASQAGHIVATSTSIVGSIGAIMTAYSFDRFYKELGIDKVTLRSEGAPDKARNPAGDKRGEKLAKKLLTDLEAVFHNYVAEGRGVSVETVRVDFGKGDVFTAGEGEAQSRGLIDAVGDLNTALSFDDSSQPRTGGYGFDNPEPAPNAGNGGDMADKSQKNQPTAPGNGGQPDASALASQVEALQAKLKASEDKAAKLKEERDAAKAQATEAKDLAADNGKRLKAAEDGLADIKASLQAERETRLKAEEDAAIQALDAYMVGDEEARARRFYKLQHVQGVESAWDDYKASLTSRKAPVDTSTRTHRSGAEPKSSSEQLHDKVVARMEKSGEAYDVALDALLAEAG